MRYTDAVVESMRFGNLPLPEGLQKELGAQSMDDLTDQQVVEVALMEAHAALDNQYRYIRELENRLVMARIKPKRTRG